MNVIFHAANLKGGAIEIVQRAGHIGMQFGLDGRWKDGHAIFRAEHQVNQNTREGLGHSWFS